MKLLLTSSGLGDQKISQEFLNLVGKPASDILILLISGAMEKERLYLERPIKELCDLGIKEENISIYKQNNTSLTDAEMMDFDAIYLGGGNTFYLLKKLKEKKFSQKLKAYMKKGGVYVGVSAGSIVAGPDIESAGWGTDADENSVNLKETTGLNLTDIVVFPHFTDKLKTEVNGFRKKVKYQILGLPDGQALLINGNESRLIK
ncbi:Peptidase E [uncultured archaeon]|nr:Peptidase E [uncultured archaeon]